MMGWLVHEAVSPLLAKSQKSLVIAGNVTHVLVTASNVTRVPGTYSIVPPRQARSQAGPSSKKRLVIATSVNTGTADLAFRKVLYFEKCSIYD